MTSLRIEPLALPFFGLILVLLFGAAQYANNLGFFFAFWLSALALGGLIGLRTRLDRVQVKPIQIDSGFANAPLHLQIEISGAHDLWLDMTLQAADTPPAPLTRHILDGSNKSSMQTLPLPQRTRGVHLAGKLRLSTTDHIGLLRVSRTYALGDKYWVYPAPHGERPLPEMARPHESQGQDDFHGLRSYQAGDSPARIHWKSLAKSSPEQPTLRVKQFGSDISSEPNPRFLDESQLMDLPLEARLSQLAAWILHCEQQQEAYTLRLRNHAPTQAGLGDAHRQHCLRLLAEAT